MLEKELFKLAIANMEGTLYTYVVILVLRVIAVLWFLHSSLVLSWQAVISLCFMIGMKLLFV